MNIFNFKYTGAEQKIQLPRGQYIINCWGADGGSASALLINKDTFELEQKVNSGGKGAFVSGLFTLKTTTELYLMVGGVGNNPKEQIENRFVGGGGFNCGGDAFCSEESLRAGGGGGATHASLQSGDILSQVRRIDKLLCVAAGGGGASANTGLSGDNAFRNFTKEAVPKVNIPRSFTGWCGGGGAPFGTCKGNHLCGTGGLSFVNVAARDKIIASAENPAWKQKPVVTENGFIQIIKL